jgi:hypothetical protein
MSRPAKGIPNSYRLCKTKPIPGYARWDGACGTRAVGQMRKTNPIRGDAAWAEAWETGDVECCTNKPNFGGGARAPSLDPPASPPAKPIVRNKPNSEGGHVRGKSCMGKELWWVGHARDFGETKPIHAPANRDGRWPAGPEVVRHRGQSCETNPIARSAAPRRCPGGAGLARVGRGTNVQNEPNSSIADFGLRIVQNEPNLPRGRAGGVVAGAHRAKQTQTWATWGIWEAARRGSLSCRTKPIPSAGRKSQVLAGKRAMVDWTCRGLRRNKANRPEPIVRQRLVARCRSGNKPNLAPRTGRRGPGGSQACETKPIPGAGWDGASGTRGNCVKQTQFPPCRVAGANRSRKTKPICGGRDTP